MIRLSVSPLTVVFASLLTSLLAGAVARGQNATVGLFNPPGSFWSVQKGTFGNSSANGSVTGQITLNDAQNNPIPWGTGVIMGSSAGSVTISGANSDNFVTAFNSGGFAKLAISDDPTGGTITPENSEAAATLVPFSGGWTSANMNGLTVQSGNTTGITIANPSTGNYTINGLPSTNEGLVMAFAQGDAAGATTDNLLSTK